MGRAGQTIVKGSLLSEPVPATPSVPMVPIEKSNHAPGQGYALNPAAVRVFVYGLRRGEKRLSLESEVSLITPSGKILGGRISSK